MPARLLAMALLVALPAACGDSRTQRQYELDGPTMGTHYSVKLVDLDAAVDRAALATQIAALVADIDARMSTYRPDSELSRFNRHPGTDWFEVSDDTRMVVEAAQRVSRMTAGAFDVTVGPLVNAWGFGPDDVRAIPPSADHVQAARARVGYEKLEVRATPAALRKQRADIYVDLSAIAKGYAVDRVAQLLDAQQVDNYLVEIGGELRARGHNAADQRWTVAVERPMANQRRVQRLLRIQDQAVATSGGYRNFIERDGRRYTHSIDPRSGAPVEHSLASVTVVDESAMAADALATAFLVLGVDAALTLANRDNIAALFIVEDADHYREFMSTSFARRTGAE